MKAMMYKYFRLCMLMVALVNFASCGASSEEEGDDFYEPYYEKSKALCGSVWADTFVDGEGNGCYQELTFYPDRRGEDYIRVDYADGTFTEDVYPFEWHWTGNSQYSLRIYYGLGDISYMDDVKIAHNILSGYLDGDHNFVEYTGI